MSTDISTGVRRRLTLDGEHYYTVVTHGAEGWHICATCSRENAPENEKIRAVADALCAAIAESLNAMPNKKNPRRSGEHTCAL